MNVGDYYRTKYGINKLTEGKCVLNDIIKSSPNIIDLIEVGDYVNGYRITTIGSNGIYAEDENGYLIKMFTKEDIKSIVTKEQFESMEYKVGE